MCYGYTFHNAQDLTVCLEYNKDTQAYLLFQNSNVVFPCKDLIRRRIEKETSNPPAILLFLFVTMDTNTIHFKLPLYSVLMRSLNCGKNIHAVENDRSKESGIKT